MGKRHTAPNDRQRQAPVASDTAGHYVTQRGEELLDRYRGTREHRKMVAEQMYEASQYRLMFAKFRKHRVARISLYLLALLYLTAIFAEFVAPYDKLDRFDDLIYAGPTKIRIRDAGGNYHWPFVYDSMSKLDLKTFKYRTVVEDDTKRYPVKFFIKTKPYKLAGIFTVDRRLFGAAGGQPVFLLGSDHLGRDLFSRIIFAARVSLFVGFGGVLISFFLGILFGGISGYFGGLVDMVIQRSIEFIMSIPQIPLWMGLSAAIPQEWTGIQTFIAITLILSLVGWTGLARVVRGKIISLREEDYVTAARISSAGHLSIIFRHLLPGFTSYLIVHITISIPFMILGETTLSFLGLGITPPDVSWGSLLQQAQDLTIIANYPWLLAPVAFVMLAVVLFNFIGDGLRDAADPYSR
jgi:peptide/nickel transport system permease protein